MDYEGLNLNEMLVLRREKLAKLQAEGKDPFKIEKYQRTHQAKEIHDNLEALVGHNVSIAGRMMSKRIQGKAGFIDIQDMSGRLQSYVREDRVDNYDDFKTFDIGDILGIEGEVFVTQKGETSVKASKITLLSKSLQILPEKWHGLKDTDIRYRQRYVDLIVNPKVKDTFILRTKIIKAVREYLDNLGYLEVDTPILNTISGGANARPFVTHHNTLDIDMYLRIANELYLKRLIVGGFDKVYEMGRMFRNEGMSIKHNPEYTAIELYEAYADYKDMMEITENLVAYVAEKCLGTTKINYQGTDIDLTPPWKRISMIDCVKKYAGVDFDSIQDDAAARRIAKEHKLNVEAGDNRGTLIAKFFEEFCEEHLVQPTFVTHHPVEISPLAKRSPEDPRLTNRFEAFMYSREIANAFSELNDPIDQRARFQDQVDLREAGDEEAQMMDDDFVNALEVGLPPTGGLGIGIDRLITFLTDSYSIRDILLFPTMKPLTKGDENKEE